MPDQPPADWWDRLYDPAATDTAGAVAPRQARVADDLDVEHDQEPQPEHHGAGQSLSARWSSWGGDRHRVGMTLNPRAQKLAYNGSAAGLGWLFDLPEQIRAVIESCGSEYGISAALVLGAGIFLAAVLLVDRRTRGWWPPLAWVCRAPAASAALALCLYAPAAS